jgi:hypothetical protein
LLEINRLAASVTGVRSIELVRKYFFFCAAFRAFASKGFQAFKGLESGTMLRSVWHFFLLLIESGVGVFFARQDAGALPAKPSSGNRLAFCCRRFKRSIPTKTDAVFCLSRRQWPSAP